MSRNTQSISWYIRWTWIVLALLLIVAPASGVQAQSADALNAQIEKKQAEIDAINRQIQSYRSQISDAEKQQRSLAGDLAILENRIKKTQLDIESAELRIDQAQLEVEETRATIRETEQRIQQSKELISVVLNELNTFDDVSPLELLFSHGAFSDFFDQIAYLETLQGDLSSTMDRVTVMRAQLQDQLAQQEEALARVADLREDLQKSKQLLEDQQSASTVLLAQSEQSEARYQSLVKELRQEQQVVQGEVFTLQESLKQKLDQGKAEGLIDTSTTALLWPVENPIITTTFHDPTYPFRYLFEHSGLDMAIPQGSPVRASASGVVAWARTTQSYGNNIMIVHANGVATLYAHLSAMNVSPDQFVGRGEVIGRSGGMPGTQGAGLSTGPHLHFETRLDGIPQNPYNYLGPR